MGLVWVLQQQKITSTVIVGVILIILGLVIVYGLLGAINDGMPAQVRAMLKKAKRKRGFNCPSKNLQTSGVQSNPYVSWIAGYRYRAIHESLVLCNEMYRVYTLNIHLIKTNIDSYYMKKILSFDAETNGLWGKPFAIAAIIYGEDGQELTHFIGRCPIEGETNEWVAQNVLPQMTEISETHESYDALLADFAKFYLANKADADMIVHMGVPVESSLLKDMHSKGYIGDWDGPYPLIDIAGNLQQVGEDPTSVDSYVTKFGLEVRDFGTTHNPLYDSEVAARVYLHLQGRK